jgi:hypothetical protein
MPQRSVEWRLVRAGKVCASEAKDLLATVKSGEAAARRDLRIAKVTECLTGTPTDADFINDAMQRGIDCEPVACRAYEAHVGVLVESVGFLEHDTLAAGCSPDGLVGDDGLVEIKCPKSATHVRYLRTDGLVDDYRAQVTHTLWIAERAWCDLVSFDDRLPPPLHLVVRRVLAKDLDLAAHEAKVREFLKEVNLDVASLKGWRVVQGAA